MFYRRPLILLCICAAPLFAWSGDEDAALDLADSAPQQPVPAAASAPDWRVFTEAAVGRVGLRQMGAADSDVAAQRLSLDLAFDKKITPTWRAVFSDRLDATLQSDATGSRTVNSLKEAYLAWQPDSRFVLDGGRINARYGAAMGYNPTDFFREGANRLITSLDPQDLRNNRMGTVMLRGQTLWQGGALTVIYAPKVADAPSTGDWNADFGATNNRRRWLAVASQQLAENVNPQVMLYGDERQPVQLGLNLSMLMGDAAVANLEWSGGRSKTLLAQALPTAAAVAQDESWHNRLAAGVTYTSASKVSFTAEYEYNGAALDQSAWGALRAGAPTDYVVYRQTLQRGLEITTRHAAFVRAAWQDAFVNRLDLTLMLRRNLDDQSQLTWLEGRYRLDHAELALQWQLASGDTFSDYGALAQSRLIQALFRYYF